MDGERKAYTPLSMNFLNSVAITSVDLGLAQFLGSIINIW